MSLEKEPSYQPLLDYWFGELVDGFADAAHRKTWFAGGAAFDAALSQRFVSLIDAALQDQLQTWLTSSRGSLAYVLVCDQLTRNVYRGQPKAFAGDRRALAATRRVLASGSDLELEPDERTFLYMPFEHSENLIDQHTCVGLFVELHDGAPPDKQPLLAGFLQYAQQHREIIREFGRFPHRNAILGRSSTPDESQFVATGPRFGQTHR